MRKRSSSKAKHYTKKEIRESRDKGETKLIHELAVKLMDGKLLTKSEAEAAASIVGISRPKGSIEPVNLAAIPGAQDYIFIKLYLAYHGDLDGRYGITKFSYEMGMLGRVATIEEKREDVIRLNEYYEKWKQMFLTDRHKDQVLNLVIIETRKDLKEIDQLLKEGKVDKKEYEDRKKGTILRSKYLYLRVAAIFEDLGCDEIIVNMNGNLIEIVPWSMVHILNRHYAKAAMQYESGKSFHSDENLKFFEDPLALKAILEKIGGHLKSSHDDIGYIPFKVNGILYLAHTKLDVKHMAGKRILHNRLQTFFPVEEQAELTKITSNYTEMMIDKDLSGYKKK